MHAGEARGDATMWGKNSANVTDSGATSVHGTNPQNLVEKILRSKIYNHAYWKEHCFGLTAESLVDKVACSHVTVVS